MSPEEKNTFLNTSPEAIPTLNFELWALQFDLIIATGDSYFELWSLQFDLMDFPQKLHHRLLNLFNRRIAKVRHDGEG